MASKPEIAIRELEARLQSNPTSLAFSRLADGYRKGGNIPRAIEICSEGLKAHPEYITGRIILGRCYLEQENFGSAIDEFKQVCQIDRHNHVALKMLADIFSKQDMKERAGDLYALLLKKDPENPSLVHLSKVFKGSGKKDVFQIVGLQPPSAAPAPASTGEGPESFDTEEISADGTGAAQATAEDVTGEDISRRMDDMFSAEGGGEAEQAIGEILEPGVSDETVVDKDLKPGPESAITQTIALEEAAVSAAEAAGGDTGEEGIEATIAVAKSGLTGEDIGSRMDTMFGEDATLETVAAADEAEGGEEAAKETPKPAKAVAPGKSATSVTGSDIADRLNEMFGAESGEEEAVSLMAEEPELVVEEEMVEEAQLPQEPGMPEVEAQEAEETPAGAVESEFDFSTEAPTQVYKVQDIMAAAKGLEKKEAVPEEGIEEAVEPLIGENASQDTDSITGRIGEALAEEAAHGAEDDLVSAISADETIHGGADLGEDTQQIAGPGSGDVGVTGEDVIARIDEILGEEGASAVPQEAEQKELPPAKDFVSADTQKIPAGVEEKAMAPKPRVKLPEKEAPAAAAGAGEKPIEAKLSETAQLSAPDLTDTISGESLADGGEMSSVTGEDVVERLEEIFGAEEVAGAEIPDEEAGEETEGAGGEFYTVSGEAAGAENEESEVLGQLEEQETAAAQPMMEPQAGEAGVSPEVPAAGQGAGEEVVEVAEELGEEMGFVEEAEEETQAGEAVAAAQAAAEPEIEAPALDIVEPPSGEEGGKASADELVSGEAAIETIPDDGDEEEEAGAQEFYTVSGEPADGAVPDEEVMATIGELEAESAPAEMPKQILEEPVQQVPSAQSVQEEEAGETPSDAETAAVADEKIASIPDHVLTPTLADIYYQQGQPHLAIQIYKRLLEKDPDNERLQSRLEEIEAHAPAAPVRRETAGMGAAFGPKPSKTRGMRRRSGRARRRRRAANDGRPLKGVRIKKKIKEKIRRGSRN